MIKVESFVTNNVLLDPGGLQDYSRRPWTCKLFAEFAGATGALSELSALHSMTWARSEVGSCTAEGSELSVKDACSPPAADSEIDESVKDACTAGMGMQMLLTTQCKCSLISSGGSSVLNKAKEFPWRPRRERCRPPAARAPAPATGPGMPFGTA